MEHPHLQASRGFGHPVLVLVLTQLHCTGTALCFLPIQDLMHVSAVTFACTLIRVLAQLCIQV